MRNRVVSLALSGLFACSSGCATKWVPLEPPYAPFHGAGKLRITQESGEQIVLQDPRLAANSHLLGTASDPERIVAIPIESVENIEKREEGNEVGYVIGSVAVVGMIVLLFSQVEVDPI
ncbi:MAG: hypothetical protein M8861_00670 [marine benthic group bacterium]|nr:hypothetical protein [Gemmatimonadota bacterium]